MAERRCFSNKITESDDFLDLPHSTQNLYFHLNMYADDRGFVKNPRSIMRACRASDDDAKLLLAKKFILSFESGVVLIKGWGIHNIVRKDRFHETVFLELLQSLYFDENGSYTTRDTGIRVINDGSECQKQIGNQLPTNCQPVGNQLGGNCHTEPNLIKSNLTKDNLNKSKEEDSKGETKASGFDDGLMTHSHSESDWESRRQAALEAMARLGMVVD